MAVSSTRINSVVSPVCGVGPDPLIVVVTCPDAGLNPDSISGITSVAILRGTATIPLPIDGAETKRVEFVSKPAYELPETDRLISLLSAVAPGEASSRGACRYTGILPLD